MIEIYIEMKWMFALYYMCSIVNQIEKKILRKIGCGCPILPKGWIGGKYYCARTIYYHSHNDFQLWECIIHVSLKFLYSNLRNNFCPLQIIHHVHIQCHPWEVLSWTIEMFFILGQHLAVNILPDRLTGFKRAPNSKH